MVTKRYHWDLKWFSKYRFRYDTWSIDYMITTGSLLPLLLKGQAIKYYDNMPRSRIFTRKVG
jgi:hypothetical protein